MIKFYDKRLKTDFKNRLKEIMETKGLKSADVCKDLGIAKSTYSQYLSGRNDAKADRVQQLAKYFDVSEAWLLGYDVPMDRYAYVNPDDAEFLKSLPPLLPTQELVPELQALNLLLQASEKNITKVNERYFITNDNGGSEVTEDELNELLNTVVIAAGAALDTLQRKKLKESFNFFDKKE